MAKTAVKSKPKLWESVKRKVTGSAKGGRAGEWSARKAQLATSEYKKRGGGYKGAKSSDNHLKKWTNEEWGTKSGRTSSATGERYLPKRARKALDEREYARTSAKKRRDSRAGKQYSKQPAGIAKKTARARSAAAAPTKAELLAKAREKKIRGRSTMSRAQLLRALGRPA